MKPESVDDGSLEKLAEKAAYKLILDFWDEFQLGQFAPEEIEAIGENLEISFLSALSEATEHERSVSQAWFEKYLDARNLWNVAPEDSHQGWISQMQDCIDKAASTAALEEKIKQIERDLDWTRDNATEHCRRADTAEAAVGENCRRIEKLESANATTPTPVLQVSDTEESANATTRIPQTSGEVKEPAKRLQEIIRVGFQRRDSVVDWPTIDPTINMLLELPLTKEEYQFLRDISRGKGVEKVVGDKQPWTMAEKKE